MVQYPHQPLTELVHLMKVLPRSYHQTSQIVLSSDSFPCSTHVARQSIIISDLRFIFLCALYFSEELLYNMSDLSSRP